MGKTYICGLIVRFRNQSIVRKGIGEKYVSRWRNRSSSSIERRYRQNNRREAQKNNIMAAKIVAEAVKTTLAHAEWTR